MEVTFPITLDLLLIFISYIESLFKDPSPAPTIISPLGNLPKVETP
ncbi:MAG: hypothetical protein ACK52J_05715 [bacterium]|jgi:hypothetical protein